MQRFLSHGVRVAAATTAVVASQAWYAYAPAAPTPHGSVRRRAGVALACSTVAMRFQSSSTAAPGGGGGRAAGARETDSAADEQSVIDSANPGSNIFEERLGFHAGDTINEEQLKARFLVLAKYYHPDNPSAPSNATEAFTSIREAYDALGKVVKGGRTYTSHSGGVGGRGDFEGGPHYADEAARRARMRALGDGVMFFVLATFVYIMVIAAHNRDRLKLRYLLHFLGIFFTIQVFPRLLAAAVLFAAHTKCLVSNAELTEQAAATLLVRQGSKEVHIDIRGLARDCAEHTVVQVEVAVEAAESLPATAAGSVTTTLTMDAGVTSFTLPLPPKGQEAHTVYHIKAVDEKRKFVVVDKQFSLA